MYIELYLFIHTLPKKSGVDRVAVRCQHILVSKKFPINSMDQFSFPFWCSNPIQFKQQICEPKFYTFRMITSADAYPATPARLVTSCQMAPFSKFTKIKRLTKIASDSLSPFQFWSRFWQSWPRFFWFSTSIDGGWTSRRPTQRPIGRTSWTRCRAKRTSTSSTRSRWRSKRIRAFKSRATFKSTGRFRPTPPPLQTSTALTTKFLATKPWV